MAETERRLSLMAIFAHPDDESFGNGCTLARYAREGVFTYLVTATRGEAGEISDPALATPDNLGQVRERELREACRILGVEELRFLNYVDGTLPSVDRHDAQRKMVRAIRELKPQVIFTFGPDGVYGHPDHVAVSEMATAAFDLAGDPTAYPEQLRDGLEAWSPSKLYYVAPTREHFARMAEMASRLVSTTPWPDMDISRFGVPEERITTRIREPEFVETKLSAIMAHQTQVMPNHPYVLLSRDQLQEFLADECYVLARSRVGPADGIEDDLFRGVR